MNDLHKIIELINNIAPRINLTDMLDIFWLAGKIPQESSVSGKKTRQTETREAVQHSRDKQPAGNESNKTLSEDIVRHNDESSASSEEKANKNLPVYPYSKKARSHRSTRVINIPAVYALTKKLEYYRAIKPLRIKTESANTLILDEAATAESIAETIIPFHARKAAGKANMAETITAENIANSAAFFPVMKPADKSGLNLAVLIEESESLFLWHTQAKEFFKVLITAGAFNKIKKYYFHYDSDEGQIHFYPRPFAKNTRRLAINFKSIQSFPGQQIVLIISDFLSDAWFKGKIFEQLYYLSKKNQITLINILPETLWPRTFFGYSEPVLFHSRHVLTPNHQLLPLSPLPETGTKKLKLPTILMTSEAVKLWAQAVTTAGAVFPGRLIPEDSELFKNTISRRQAAASPGELYQTFKLNALSLTQKLALYYSMIPLSLPWMRILQQLMLPQSAPHHLMEFLFSGLITHRQADAHLLREDEIEFQFKPGIKELLHQDLGSFEEKKLTKTFSLKHALEPENAIITKMTAYLNHPSKSGPPVRAIVAGLAGQGTGGPARQPIGLLPSDEDNDFSARDKESAKAIETDLASLKELEQKLGKNITARKSPAELHDDEGYYVSNNQMTGLSLAGFELTSIPSGIGRFTKLEYLNLSHNKLVEISQLETLISLQNLNLSANNIKDLLPLRQLAQLEALDLQNNRIRDLAPLRDLTRLTFLNLSFNAISDLEPLKNLVELTSLYLSENNLSQINPLKRLGGLTCLALGSNRITDIAPLEDLTNLTTLYLSSNQISNLEALETLKGLTVLDLSKNPITALPGWIAEFPHMDIEWSAHDPSTLVLNKKKAIYFYDNPITNPPQEIIRKGKAAILDWFHNQANQGSECLCEAKLLILGEGGSGKTTLLRKLIDPASPLSGAEETTRGIDVEPLTFHLHHTLGDFPPPAGGHRLTLNAWDFRGQQIYQATHRFFLSKRSLYLLVVDNRNESTDLPFWLQLIEKYGGDSPLLLVLNEKDDRPCRINYAALRGRFANIKDKYEVNFATNRGLETLTEGIRHHVGTLPHLGTRVPATWKKIRQRLAGETAPWLTRDRFLALCAGEGLAQEDALLMSGFFHDFGAYLHFQQDRLLRRFLFLDPEWVTGAVYRLIDSRLLAAGRGEFNEEQAGEIWERTDYGDMLPELLALMKRFLLIYQVGSQPRYVAPQFLPPEEPAYPWEEGENQVLKYVYDEFMPRGIIAQLIVKLHRYIPRQEWVWYAGVILVREETYAEVIESYGNREIRIRLQGRDRRSLLTLITEALDEINAGYEKQEVSRLIPCNCPACGEAPDPQFYRYEKLLEYIENGRREIECDRIPYHRVRVLSLVEKVFDDRSLDRLLGREESRSPEEETGVAGARDTVFISYAHVDHESFDLVCKHLRTLEKQGARLSIWTDQEVRPGQLWREEIRKALERTRVAVLLVSVDFINSLFIRTVELPSLLQAAETDGTAILPLIVRPCYFSDLPRLGEYQMVHCLDEPLSSLPVNKREKVLINLTQMVRSQLFPD